VLVQEPGGNLRALGSHLAVFIKHRSPEQLTASSLQAVIADLAVDHSDLIAPLKDLVSRQSFLSLIPHATSGGGAIQRDALIQEISRVYHPAVLIEIEDVLNGFLESSGGVASQLSQSVFIKDQSSSAQTGGNKSVVDSEPRMPSSSPKSDNIQMHSLSVSKSYFPLALEIAQKMDGANLSSASANTSGKGLLNYVLRDSSGNELTRVSLAMIDAKLRSLRSARPNQQGSTSHLSTSNSCDPFFLKAVELAERMGNTNLAEASAPASSKGIVNYTIRDAMSNTLAKVPLSMLQNAFK
jgi:hypothetical protein